jgi:hypothetical protein
MILESDQDKTGQEQYQVEDNSKPVTNQRVCNREKGFHKDFSQIEWYHKEIESHGFCHQLAETCMYPAAGMFFNIQKEWREN